MDSEGAPVTENMDATKVMSAAEYVDVHREIGTLFFIFINQPIQCSETVRYRLEGQDSECTLYGIIQKRFTTPLTAAFSRGAL